MTKMLIGLHVEYPYCCQILMRLGFSQQIFEKNTRISYFMKILPVGAKLFHADGRTDMTKVIVAFRNSVNAPEKCQRRHAVYTNLKKNAWICSKFVWGDKKKTHTHKQGRAHTNGRTDWYTFTSFPFKLLTVMPFFLLVTNTVLEKAHKLRQQSRTNYILPTRTVHVQVHLHLPSTLNVCLT
jgi:hypothetical protein